MSSIIGFMLTRGVENQSKPETAPQRMLSHFPHLQQLTLNIGDSKLSVWGHDSLTDCIHPMPDGSILALIGPRAGIHSWESIQTQLARDPNPENFEIPWEGRVVLVRISQDGRQWTMWNDWLGSMPVFHAAIGNGWIASTLEPAVVESAKFRANDIFLPGMIMLLVHGHMIGDWTLYKSMKIVPPDSIAEWSDKGFSWKQRFTIQPTTERWETGQDELVDELHELTRQTIGSVLKTRPSWILPLSSGLDSRIIAAVGAELGFHMRAYTWGNPHSEDAEYAPQIARTLGIPWKWINIGTDYLARYVRVWADLFGSAMHFHGMYQMSFLDALKAEPPAPIMSGFLGDTLAGYDVHFQTAFHTPNVRTYQAVEDGYLHWKVSEIGTLLKMDTNAALEEIASEIEKQRTLVLGPWYQRIRFLTLWGRQRHFTYFQAKLDSFWYGSEMPYINRAYAKFCFSLPRIALEHRILQGEMLRRYYGKIAVIPGSFAPTPLIPTGRYLLNKRIARSLPARLRTGPLRDFSLVPLSRDAESVKNGGEKAIWPIREAWKQLREWMDLDLIKCEYQAAIHGNIRSVRKLQSVQTLAYRLMET